MCYRCVHMYRGHVVVWLLTVIMGCMHVFCLHSYLCTCYRIGTGAYKSFYTVLYFTYILQWVTHGEMSVVCLLAPFPSSCLIRENFWLSPPLRSIAKQMFLKAPTVWPSSLPPEPRVNILLPRSCSPPPCVSGCSSSRWFMLAACSTFIIVFMRNIQMYHLK